MCVPCPSITSLFMIVNSSQILSIGKHYMSCTVTLANRVTVEYNVKINNIDNVQ